MGSAIHKTRIGGVGLLEARQLTHYPLVKQDRSWVPPAVRDEAIVKDVKTTQALVGKVGLEKILEFTGGKEVEVHRNTASVVELDVAPIQTMIEIEVSGSFDRIDEYGRCAADRADGSYEMALGHSGKLGCNFR
jgi:hypothetical protein